MPDVDDDLRDVFASLYDGDEWDDWAEDDTTNKDEPVPHAAPHRHSRAYLRAALASLTAPPPPAVPAKRRIYPAQPPAPGLLPSTSPLPPVDAAAYAPFSPLPLLARLRTFTPRTYSPLLSPSLSPLALARAGWVNSGKDGLACAGSCPASVPNDSSASTSTSANGKKLGCSAVWGVGGLENISDPRVRNEIVRRLAATLTSRHEAGCGWRVLASPASLGDHLRRLVHPLISASLTPLARALQVRSLGPVPPAWTSPLSASQLDKLCASLTRASAAEAVAAPLEHLEAALALFGWYPYDPASPSSADHVAHSTVPGQAPKTDIVACRACQRRVGLWMFATTDAGTKVFDVHGQHLWWCPLAAAGWWTDCPLLAAAPERAPTDPVPRLSDVPAPKRWKRRAAATDTAAAAPVAGVAAPPAVTV